MQSFDHDEINQIVHNMTQKEGDGETKQSRKEKKEASETFQPVDIKGLK